MSDSTIDRVVAEAALAKRFSTKIDELASQADIPVLVEAVEVYESQFASDDEVASAFETSGLATQQGVDEAIQGVRDEIPSTSGLATQQEVGDSIQGVLDAMPSSPIALDTDGVPYLTDGE